MTPGNPATDPAPDPLTPGRGGEAAPSPTTAPAGVRVLLVDDEQLMRAGLRLMIDGSDGIEVVGEAADGAAALEAVAALDPDVVLMDIRMPHMDGIEATRRLSGDGARPGVVVLTAFDTDGFLLDALRAGAVSFLLKDSPPEQVVEGIHEAARGEARFSPAVLRRLVALAAASPGPQAGSAADRTGAAADRTGPAVEHNAPSADRREAAAELTPFGTPERTQPVPADASSLPHAITEREWEVGRLVAQGLTNSEIADALFLSLPTIKTHIGHLFEKLLVTNRVQLAIRVLEIDGGA
ncbi:response regulator transcription factor [Brachybacterium halotolerans subsp. kimchii]|uniref:response regulator transcription factor n=1 Tax=Brachybacterium halotolerans TaxID=2795215 RepID=UPI001E651548|nr:response regulator transcription factor [Brachybacterium halotolerans]UEJ81151.1 response regulator transcription factor [Brachybacterium halotolerans subsp. kimchii]